MPEGGYTKEFVEEAIRKTFYYHKRYNYPQFYFSLERDDQDRLQIVGNASGHTPRNRTLPLVMQACNGPVTPIPFMVETLGYELDAAPMCECNRCEECTELFETRLLMEWTLNEGRLNLLKWLIEERGVPLLKSALWHAASGNQIETLDYLITVDSSLLIPDKYTSALYDLESNAWLDAYRQERKKQRE